MISLSISVLLLTVELKTAWVVNVKSALYSYVYMPLNTLAVWPMRFADKRWQLWQLRRDLLENVAQLEAENHVLRAQLLQYGHFQAENRRLRMLMDSLPTITAPVLIAELLNSNIDGYHEVITVNKGKQHQVYHQQAVIDPYGLVGQVTEVHQKQAHIMLISDTRSRVPAYVERTFQRVVVVGSPEAGGLEMPWQRYDSDIVVGDRLISSGLGGVFPRGYPVAEVVSIEGGQAASYVTVKLKPIAHLHSMLEVLLLNIRTPTPTMVNPLLDTGPRLPASEPAAILEVQGADDNAT